MIVKNLFDVVISNEIGVAKDPHPLGAYPTKPYRSDFKNNEQFMKAELLFLDVEKKWLEIELALKTYIITSMSTDAGEIISGKVLHWHVGKKYKAIQDPHQSRFEAIQVV